jgi:hypothetical protein
MGKSIAIATACCFAALVSADGSAFAQAGSTGGTIGKTDKSASGGEDAAPLSPSTAPKAPNRRDRARAAVTGPAVGSVSGRWRWIADCPSGHWEAEFALSDVSNGHFTGNFSGASEGTITEGSVDGRNIAFTRHFSWVVVQRWVGQVSGGHMNGSLSGNENCTWQANKF